MHHAKKQGFFDKIFRPKDSKNAKHHSGKEIDGVEKIHSDKKVRKIL